MPAARRSLWVLPHCAGRRESLPLGGPWGAGSSSKRQQLGIRWQQWQGLGFPRGFLRRRGEERVRAFEIERFSTLCLPEGA